MQISSFRMRAGRVRNLTGHIQRLQLSPAAELRMRAQLRAAGEQPCFPQVDAAGDVSLRPDRPITTTVRVDPALHRDCRHYPTIKGPDLKWLAAAQQLSRARGYDEGLLSDGDDFIIEGIFSTLVVFDPDPVFNTHPRALPSTTAPLVERFFAEHGQPVSYRPLTCADRNEPMWLLNAFSGARTTDPELLPVTDVNSWMWEQAERV